MNRRFIVFSSEHDDGELFCTAAGDLWKGFGTGHKRFVIGLDQKQRGDLYCWKELPHDFDMLVVWEPLDSTEDTIQKYKEFLDSIRQECSHCFPTSQEIYALYHNSSHAECKQLQEAFIQKLLKKKTAVFPASYSHIKSDGLYRKVASLLDAGWDMADLKEYQTTLKKLLTAWPDKTYRIYHLISLSILLQGALAVLRPAIIFPDSNDEKENGFNGVFDFRRWFEECLPGVGKFVGGDQLDSIEEIAGCDNLQKLLALFLAASSGSQQPLSADNKGIDLLAGAHNELQEKFIQLRG